MSALRVITVVPCRTKSTRLPGKALRPIYGISSIQRCLLNTMAIGHSEVSVLATSTNPEDDVLIAHTVATRADFVRGPEDDVLERFFTAIERHQADIVIRVTGDCPVVSYEMADLLVEAHLASNADVTHAQPGFPVGISSEVYRVSALYRLRSLMPQTPHSEYLILYFLNNPETFRLNPIALPGHYHRKWRLTLDEQSDLDLFERMFSALDVGWRAVAFQEIVDFFAAHPEAAQINADNKIRYVHDQEFVSYLRQVTTIKTNQVQEVLS